MTTDNTQIVYDTCSKLPAVLPMLTGALIALLAAWLTNWFSMRRDRENAARAADHRRAVVAAAIAAEIRGLLARYDETIGRALDAATQWNEFLVQYVARFNYFVVFDSNTSEIGSLPPNVAADVVAFYVLAKGHFDSVLNWSQEMEALATLSAEELRLRTDSLDRFFKQLKQDCASLRQRAPQVVASLKNFRKN